MIAHLCKFSFIALLKVVNWSKI